MEESFTEWFDRNVRERCGTLRELARKAKLSVSIVSLIKRGVRRPSAATAARLAKAMGMDEAHFLAKAGVVSVAARKMLRVDLALVETVNLLAKLPPADRQVLAASARRKLARAA